MLNNRLILIGLFTFALAAGMVSGVAAQNIPKSWMVIQGSAVDISVGVDGSVVAVNDKGRVYEFDHGDAEWHPIGEAISRVAVDKNGAYWAVDKFGTLRTYTGTRWSAVGEGADDVAAASDGLIYVTTNTAYIAVYDPQKRTWRAIDGRAKRLAVDAEGLIWGVTENGSIARRLDNAWIGMAGKAVDIAADETGRILMVGQDGNLYEWREAQAGWVAHSDASGVGAVSIGDDQIWRADISGKIYAFGIADKLHKENDIITTVAGGNGSTDANAVRDTSEIIFEKISSTTKLADLAIGQDGSVYGLTSSGDIRRWSNSESRFYEFPGKVDRIAIRDDGLPIAIGTKGNLVEHDGEAWRLVNLGLSLIDLALYGRDEILGINDREQAVNVANSKTSYELLPQKGQQIAAQRNGSFWVIDSVNRLFKCDEAGACEQQAIKAEDISIGPAGSVFIVDTNATLRRYNEGDDSFEIIRKGNTARVAAGPNDRPWILDNTGLVYAANYFERDESRDRNIAIRTAVTKNITETQINALNNSGIQILQNISFTAVTIPTSAAGFPNLGTGLRDITSGADDILIATGFKGPCVDGKGLNWVYNPVTKSFNHLDYLKRINLFTVIAVDDLIVGAVNGDTPPKTPPPSIPSLIGEWNKSCADQSNLVTYVRGVFEDSSAMSSQNFDGATFASPLPLNELPDIDFAADGSVANIGPGNTLEIFQPETADDVEDFDEIFFQRVGIGENKDDIWAMSTTNNVYEYIKSSDTFELRSQNSDDKAQDVGVGLDGTVFIVNLSGTLKKWDPVAKRFVKTNKAGITRVAVDSRGNPIVANFPSSQTVYFGR